MLPPSTPRKPSLLTLVPQSGLQFLAGELDLSAVDIPAIAFREIQAADPAKPPTLILMRPNEIAEARANGGVLPADAYAVRADAALLLFEGQWLPLPYFEIASVDMAGKPSFKRGPTNWARIRLTRQKDHVD